MDIKLERLLELKEILDSLSQDTNNLSEIEFINQKFKTSFTEDTVSLFTFMGSDNLVNRSFRKWHKDTLVQIKEKSEDIPLTINHEWWDAGEIIGRVYSTELKTFSSIPEGYKQVMGYEDINRKIVEKEGLMCVYFHCFVPKFESFVSKLESKIVGDCSTGGFLDDVELICPICSEMHEREVSFFEKDKKGEYLCPHYMPFSFMNPLYVKDDEYNFAPYVELKGEYDSVELSVVVCGNLPQASLVK